MNQSVEVAKAKHSEDASSIPEYPSGGGRQRIDFLARRFPGVKVRKVGADARRHRDFQSAASILHEMPGQLLVSKQKLRRAEAIACVRLKRQEAVQSLGFASRPFVLCGLPIKRPVAGQLLHERRNGQFVLQVTGHPSYGLPWGQDRLVPIFLATLAIRQQTPRITFDSAAEMLDSFGLQQGGSQYRRLVAAFQRIFGATVGRRRTFFQTEPSNHLHQPALSYPHSPIRIALDRRWGSSAQHVHVGLLSWARPNTAGGSEGIHLLSLANLPLVACTPRT